MTKHRLESNAGRIHIHSHATGLIHPWAHEITRRRSEVMASLRAESVFLESYFLHQTPQGTSLCAFMKAQNLGRASLVGQHSVAPIDEFHSRFKDAAWGKKQCAEHLFSHDTLRTEEAESSIADCFLYTITASELGAIRTWIEDLKEREDRGEALINPAFEGVSLFFEADSQGGQLWQFQYGSDAQHHDNAIFLDPTPLSSLRQPSPTRLLPLVHFINPEIEQDHM